MLFSFCFCLLLLLFGFCLYRLFWDQTMMATTDDIDDGVCARAQNDDGKDGCAHSRTRAPRRETTTTKNNDFSIKSDVTKSHHCLLRFRCCFFSSLISPCLLVVRFIGFWTTVELSTVSLSRQLFWPSVCPNEYS